MKNTIHKFFSFKSNSVFYRLTMAFGLFFMGPLLGILFIAQKTDLFGSNELLYCLGGLLLSAFFGYVIMRQISSGISNVEKKMAEKMEGLSKVGKIAEDELTNIQTFTDILTKSAKKTDESLSQRVREINALARLSNTSVDPDGAEPFVKRAITQAMDAVAARGGAFVLIQEASLKVKYIKDTGIRRDLGKQIKSLAMTLQEVIEDNEYIFWSHKKCPSPVATLFSEPAMSGAVIPLGNMEEGAIVVLLACEKESGWEKISQEFLSAYFLQLTNILKIGEIAGRNHYSSAEFESISAIIKLLKAGPSDRELLIDMAKIIEEVVPYHWLGLAQVNEETGDLYLSQAFGKEKAGVKLGAVIKGENSLFHRAMSSFETFFLKDLDREEFFVEAELLGEFQLKSCLVVGLKSGRRGIGALCLASEKKNGFSKREQHLFTMVGLGVSIALEQSRAFFQERAKRKELEVLNKIGIALSSQTIQAQKILSFVLTKLGELIDCESGAVMVLDYDELVVKAATGEFEKELEGQKFNLNHGVSGFVVATGESVRVEDVQETPNFVSVIDEMTGFETRSLLCVPMISGGRVIGVIELLNSKSKPFQENDMKLLKTVASHTAIALETSRLYDETNHMAKKERFIREIFQMYVPEQIVSDILKRGETKHLSLGERKIVTIFNVDIRGYSEMSKQASTEDVFDILNLFFKRMGSIVLQHNGVLDKYLGDGLMAIFGAPVASSNPALDAVRAAQEMIKEIEAISLLAIDRCGLPVKVGISINTGEAIVGNIGFDKKVEYTVIGDVVNETFRLQEITKEKMNSILISESTKQQVQSEVATISKGLRKIGTAVMNVYEVPFNVTGDGEQIITTTDIVEPEAKIH